MQPALVSPRDLSAPAVRAFVKIAIAWQMDLAEQRAALGGISRQTIYNWREHPERARLTHRFHSVVGRLPSCCLVGACSILFGSGAT
jgi:hypothetical protein